VQIVLRRGRRQEKDKQLYIEKVLQHVCIVLKCVLVLVWTLLAAQGVQKESEGNDKLQVVM
tara:strand:+ start:860 stop:1042 length:183 start_codon:yes stop_codon:yes gene_type:complete